MPASEFLLGMGFLQNKEWLEETGPCTNTEKL